MNFNNNIGSCIMVEERPTRKSYVYMGIHIVKTSDCTLKNLHFIFYILYWNKDLKGKEKKSRKSFGFYKITFLFISSVFI